MKEVDRLAWTLAVLHATGLSPADDDAGRNTATLLDFLKLSRSSHLDDNQSQPNLLDVRA